MGGETLGRAVEVALTCSALAATACGGGDGGETEPEPTSTAPSISDVSCSPSTVEASVDAQRIDFAFSFTDPEADVDGMRGWLSGPSLQPGEEPVPYGGNPTGVDSGATEGVVEGFFELTQLSGNDQALGNWEFEVAAVDGAGNESNHLTCTVTVFEPG